MALDRIQMIKSIQNLSATRTQQGPAETIVVTIPQAVDVNKTVINYPSATGTGTGSGIIQTTYELTNSTTVTVRTLDSTLLADIPDYKFQVIEHY